MLTNFIYSQSKGLFLEQLQAGNVPEDAIAFLEDSGEIWNRDHYFGSTGVSNLLTDGKLIGTITANNNPYNIYAPKTYDWSEITGTENVLTTAGGVIKGSFDAFTINRNGGGVVSSIAFKHSDSLLYGYLGFDDVNNPMWMDPSYNRYFFLHQGNYFKYVLPLTGGTISGRLTISSESDAKIIFNETGTEVKYQQIAFQDHGVEYGRLGTYGDDQLKWTGKILLHEGNIGDYALKNYNNQGAVDYNNVLYDGIQYVSGASTNTPIKYGILMSTSIGDASWQLLGGRLNEGLYFRGGSNNGTGWGDWKTIAFTDSNITGNAASANRFKLLSLNGEIDLNTALASGGIAMQYNNYIDGAWQNAPFARYGAVIQFTRGATQELSGQLLWDINHNSTEDATRHLWWRAADINGFTNSKWHRIAFTDSNVASAQALVNSNGTEGATVDDKGRILSSGYGICEKNEKWQLSTAGYIGNIQGTMSDGVELRSPKGIVLATNKIGMLINSSGNVTIGENDLAGSAGAKLFVDGNTYTRGGSIYSVEDSNIAYYGPAQKGIGSNYDGALMYAYDSRPLYFYTGSVRMLINGAGNVTIGNQDYAGTGYRLWVNGATNVEGNLRMAGELIFAGGYSIQSYNNTALSLNPQGNNILLSPNGYSNVLIGTTIDNGLSLQVAGSASISSIVLIGGAAYESGVNLKVKGLSKLETLYTNGTVFNYSSDKSSRLTTAWANDIVRIYANNSDGAAPKNMYLGDYNGNCLNLVDGGKVLIGTTTDNGARLQVAGDTHIKGNLKVDGEFDLGGIEETVSDEFTIRSTGNSNAIKDGLARIESVKGNSIVWNQLIELENAYLNQWLPTLLSNSTLVSTKSTIDWKVNTDIQQSRLWIYFPPERKIFASHKYLFIGIGSYNLPNSLYLHNGASSVIIGNSGEKTLNSQIIKFTQDGNQLSIFTLDGPTLDVTHYIKGGFYIHDLTQMFGAGNEPATVEEFYARIPQNIDLYAYNEGEVIHNNTDAIKSVGFNQWDEEWELGVIEQNTGENKASSAGIRSKNFMPCIPSTSYYKFSPNVNTCIYWYDENKKLVKRDGEGFSHNILTTSPERARYFRFDTYSLDNYTTYNGGICINISDSSFNGTYEPYISREYSLDIIEKYFPNGMKSAGTVHDEIRYNKISGKCEAIKRIGEVDLGTFVWTYNTYQNAYYFQSDVFTFRNGLNDNALIIIYKHSKENNVVSLEDKHFIITANCCWIKDSTYTDAATFKAAMQGVMLYYELAEPIITEIEESVNFDYEVWNGGTERVISNVPSTSFKADITYGFSANKVIKENRLDINTLFDKLENGILNITYSELKSLRDNSQLIPGMQYRITDYITTTVQTDTQSAGHQFDIIVIADNENTLNEKARAIQHDGDTYFANSNLAAWEIWYCLDNDTDRFAWADIENGTGVIYRMIDEFRNDCPYDFKNIQFKRWQITSDHEIFANDKSIIEGTYVGFKPTDFLDITMNSNIKILNDDDYKWYYTFSGVNSSNNIIDVSNENNTCYNNSLKCYYSDSHIKILNNIVMYAKTYNIFGVIFEPNCASMTLYNNSDYYLYENIFKSECKGNIFTGNCQIAVNNFSGESNYNIICCNNSSERISFANNKINQKFRNNIITNAVLGNVFGSQVEQNIILGRVESCTIKDEFNNNIIKSNFIANNVSDNVRDNTFNGIVQYVNIDYAFINNIINTKLNTVTFGAGCQNNIFTSIINTSIDKMCQNNIISNVSASHIGIGFRYNRFRTNSDINSEDRPGITGCTFGDYVWFNNFYNTDTSSAKIKCLNVQSYLQGTESNYNHIEVPVNSDTEIKVAKNSAGEIKVYCEADLV